MNIPLHEQWTERMSVWGIAVYIETLMKVLMGVVGNYRLNYPIFNAGSIDIPIHEYGKYLATFHIDQHYGAIRYRLENEAMDQTEVDNLLNRIDAALFKNFDGVILVSTEVWE